MKAKEPTATSAGRISGSTTAMNARGREQPSSIAASSSSNGMPRMKVLISMAASGIWKTVSMTIRLPRLLISDRFLKMTNSGISSMAPGTNCVHSSTRTKTFLPRKRYRARP